MIPNENRKIIVGMSGGLDSSCAAQLLLDAGYDVTGVMIRFCDRTDPADARKSADELGIPLVVVDATEEFEGLVISDFIHRYCEGTTPNPCVICNRLVKFAKLTECADRLGCAYIATGHYAGIDCIDGRFCVRRGEDRTKDQSYMLWNLTQEELSRTVFPLGGCKKADLRKSFAEKGFSFSAQPESEDLCFTDLKAGEYIEQRLGKLPEGNFVDENGKILGRHRGIIHYTVGQRKGLGVSAGRRVFVSHINAQRNEVVLSAQNSSDSEINVRELNFQALPPPVAGDELRLAVKLRYHAPEIMARVTFLNDGCDLAATVHLEEPFPAAAPGQSAVFYNGDTVAFGGLITY